MENGFDIQKYLADGAENIVKNAISATFKNPKETLFLAKFIKNSRKASKIRKKYARDGINIPAFLIASITGECNLHCEGVIQEQTESVVRSFQIISFQLMTGKIFLINQGIWE